MFAISTFQRSHTLIPPSVTGSNQPRWDNVAGELASPTLLLPCRSVSVPSKLHRLLSETDSFHALWNDKLLKSFNIFYVSKGVLFIKKNKFSCFTAFWGYLMFHSWYFVRSCNQTGVLHWKWILVSTIDLSAPINHGYQDCEVLAYSCCGDDILFLCNSGNRFLAYTVYDINIKFPFYFSVWSPFFIPQTCLIQDRKLVCDFANFVLSPCGGVTAWFTNSCVES